MIHQKIRPYLELIGFGGLADKMPPQKFIVASIYADALDQVIDNSADFDNVKPELDKWWEQYGEAKRYSKYLAGLEALTNLQSKEPITQQIIALARDLIIMLPIVKT